MAEMDEASERARQAIESDTLDAMDGDRVRFENTGDPLFAWQALVTWRSLNRNRARTQVAPLPMPGWVEDYLDCAAPRIMRLAHGHDFEGRPPLREHPHRSVRRAESRIVATLGLPRGRP